ncbi:transcriptional regulator, MucR family [Geobacter metallireducens RCH3]|uniref:Transcriptional regulator, Ros/MucR family n=1 Tax=Geobacter metallireducens (strain ATCC 53774 / DSM 7210 / GS-15) TaxID=269799 RepID=Q39W33_GEOMG|nr:MucR family transcriptional regulator [Geobacter metallireducens]ABB31541.1 transcriptional regulator, Ros/MucR family [Geobacter metallireducens GS-15]EHP88368.1 transcriptional regulator, MucR family [Geobacter metallireducens RCH3]
MASTLLELTAGIVSSHAAMSELSTEELVQEIQKVYTTLQQLEGGAPEAAQAEETKAPVISLKKAFQADQVVCMICGKGGMKTLTRHLAQVHDMKPREYRKQFNIPSSQALTARKFSEARKKMAQERGLADNLAKARAVRATKIQEKKGAPAEKPAKPKGAPRKKKA